MNNDNNVLDDAIVVKQCATFGCTNDVWKNLIIAPGTMVQLCIECYARESGNLGGE